MSRLASRLRRHRRGADPAGPEPSAPALLTVVLSADGDLGAGSLASVLAQSYQAIEVLVVAPGPAGADQSRLMSNDSRVRGLSAPAGVAAGWNAGAAAATGRYLTLLEAGDLVSSDGYRTLVDHLESSGSDLAVGSYDQLRLGEPQPPPRWVTALHAAVRHRVTLNELPALLANEVLSTKVFRRSYFERAGLQVTDSPLGELDLTTSGYALASSIEVATVPVVHRRAAPSRPVTVPERRAAAERTLRLLSAHASSTVPARYAAQLLAQDPFGLDEIARDEDAHWQTLQAGVRLLTAVAEEAAVHELVPAADRVLYWLLEHDRQEAAVRFVESGGRATELWEQRVVEGRVLLQLPYSGDAGVGVPTGCFVPAQTEVELRSGVTSAAFTDDGQLRLRGFAFLTCTGPELGLPRVELVEHQLGLRVPMQVRHRPDPAARRRSGHERIDYARSGFEATLDVRRLRAAAPPDGGAFQLEIALEACGTTRTGSPDGRAGVLASLPAQVIDGEVLVLPSWSEPDGLVLTVQPSTAAPAGTGPASVVLTDVALDDTDLLLQCALADPGIETVSAELTGPAHTLRTGPVAAADGRITLRFSLSTEEETGFDPVAPSSGRYRIELRRHPDGSRPLVVAMDERLSVEGWPDLLGPLARVTLRPNRRG
ncbi:MAG TPA: glycosyltransferase, partial [Candidatus Nanopelagicales bacterium]|nr:glycosyltransferase [Candidatus Nanopelagicales bacterium]